jgi:hypothetical protein
VLLNVIPTLLLIAFGFWWSQVEYYFRTTQPYIKLSCGGVANELVLVDYNYDSDVQLPVNAFRRKHWKLGYISTMSFLVRFATVLAGGVFIQATTPLLSQNELTYPLRQVWRQNHEISAFGSNTYTKVELPIVDAVMKGVRESGWISNAHLFLQVELTHEHNYMALSGIDGNLTCSDMSGKFEYDGSLVPGRVSLVDGDCPGYDRPVCSPETNVTEGNCLTWSYIPNQNCSKTISDGSGRYWFYCSFFDEDVAEKGLLLETSFLCKAGFYNETVQAFVDQANTSTGTTICHKSG